MCLVEDEVQKTRRDAARVAVDRIINETPRQISTEMYVRSVAFAAYAEGWNGKADEVNAGSDAAIKVKLEIAEEIENHSYLAGTHGINVWIDSLTKRLREEGSNVTSQR